MQEFMGLRVPHCYYMFHLVFPKDRSVKGWFAVVRQIKIQPRSVWIVGLQHEFHVAAKLCPEFVKIPGTKALRGLVTVSDNSSQLSTFSSASQSLR